MTEPVPPPQARMSKNQKRIVLTLVLIASLIVGIGGRLLLRHSAADLLFDLLAALGFYGLAGYWLVVGARALWRSAA
jgi:hypothetical protein